ncbi:ABC transporter permease subunit [Streptomyces heilongjiangensis]|uniref:ABC transporter permease subunit n=1 Tax=Streptomyces heilongjiangensis TaxID=945052 RepID=A0ABW1BHY7_9ACTN|nr:ABC transporter permease subunit [Streptomyces heilongjiangensis]MDC2951815.1 ABC transporter permease subunit [Streptomyces heilongjiangensis]
MSATTATTATLRSEWAKLTTVRSTGWTLFAAFAVTVAFGTLISALSNAQYDDLSQQEKLNFDAAGTSFTGGVLGQLAMIAFGVMVIGGEYSTGMIRNSLAAVPRRGLFYFGKLTVATGAALVVGITTSFVTFFAGQAVLGSHSTTIGAENVLRATLGAGLYMTLMAVFSMGVATMLRSSMLAMGILMPFFFLVTQILGSVPGAKDVAHYLPDQAGEAMARTVPLEDVPYGPGGGLLIMLLWVAASVLGGYLVLRGRDA